MTESSHLSVARCRTREAGQCLPPLEQSFKNRRRFRPDSSQEPRRPARCGGRLDAGHENGRGARCRGVASRPSPGAMSTFWGGGTSPDVKGLRGEETAGRVVSRSLTLEQSSLPFEGESMVRRILEQVFTLLKAGRTDPSPRSRREARHRRRLGVRPGSRIRPGRSSGAPLASGRRRARGPRPATLA
jgi:hypothetical protein